MPPIDPFDINELLRFRVNLDIPAFVRSAVREQMNRAEVLGYLHIITNTHQGTEKMWRFVPVAKEKALSRNEILVWLHISYGGLLEPKHLSQELRIPLQFAENALAVLEEKGIIKEGRVL